MQRQNFKLSIIFLAAFSVMHFTGMLLEKIPYIINAVVVFTVVLAALLLPGKWLLGKTFKYTVTAIGFRKTRFENIMPGMIVSAALLCMYPVLGYLLNTNIRLTKNWLLDMIGLLLTGGLAEEMLFRGFLFGGLGKQMPFKKAVFVSAIVFTIAHLLLFGSFTWLVALLSTLLAASLSLPFAYLFEKADNSIWSAAMVHAIIRTVGMVITTTEENFIVLSSVWIIISLVVPYVVLMFYKSFRQILYTK